VELLIYFILWYQLFLNFCFDENLYYVCLLLCLCLPAKPWKKQTYFTRVLKDQFIFCYKKSKYQINHIAFLVRCRFFRMSDKMKHPERVPNCIYL